MTDAEAELLASRVLAAIDAEDELLRDLSLEIHGHPELAFSEHHAHAVLTDFLGARSFEVTRGAFGLPTAFRAVAGSGTPVVAILCEYDALPTIGHACGHNLIAMSGVAAALGVQAALKPGAGTLIVLGSPAEESGGGKLDLIRAGAFDGVDAAVMCHPVGGNGRITAGQVAPGYTSTAVQHLDIEFIGKEAHAAAAPWLGVNALDAAVHAYQAIALLRQQIASTARVHGIITHGGDAPNVIPGRSAMQFFVRERSFEALATLCARVERCFEAAAVATGCQLNYVRDTRSYVDMLPNSALAERYGSRAQALGLAVIPYASDASTDMGNVSRVVPSIHVGVGVDATNVNHHPGFTAAASTVEAHAAMLRAAKAMGLTVLDVIEDVDLRRKIREEWVRRDLKM